MGTEKCRSCSHWGLGRANAGYFCVSGRACGILEKDEWAGTKERHRSKVEKLIGSITWRVISYSGKFSILTIKCYYLESSANTNPTDPDLLLPCSILYRR